MAEEKIDDVEVVDEASGGKSKKMIIIIAVAVFAIGKGSVGWGEQEAQEMIDNSDVGDPNLNY